MIHDFNFVCPCCGYTLVYSEAVRETVLSGVARHYGLSPHDVAFASYCTNKNAMEARAVAVYFLRLFTGAPFKAINEAFNWEPSSNQAGNQCARIIHAAEESPVFSNRLERLQGDLMDALKNLAEKKVA
jgi:hypothetical protein